MGDGKLISPPETADEYLDQEFDQTSPIKPLYDKDRSVSQLQQNNVEVVFDDEGVFSEKEMS